MIRIIDPLSNKVIIYLIICIVRSYAWYDVLYSFTNNEVLTWTVSKIYSKLDNLLRYVLFIDWISFIYGFRVLIN